MGDRYDNWNRVENRQNAQGKLGEEAGQQEQDPAFLRRGLGMSPGSKAKE